MLTLILILLLFGATFYSFSNPMFYHKFVFTINATSGYNQYYRLITSGFIHHNWVQFFINAFMLYTASKSCELALGSAATVSVFLFCIIASNAMFWLIYKSNIDLINEPVTGATAGVLGLWFALITINPKASMMFLFIPIPIPAWVFVILFFGFIFYMMQKDTTSTYSITSSGGAFAGVIAATCLQPKASLQHLYFILLMLGFICVLVYLLIAHKHLFQLSWLNNKSTDYTLDDRFNITQNQRQEKLDSILDKINKSGIQSISKKEKEFLDTFSQ
jgi:membrane associated rhomboid family serine protease